MLSRRPLFHGLLIGEPCQCSLRRPRINYQHLCGKNDNAFLAVDDVAVLQAAADRLSPQIIRNNSTIGRSFWAPNSPSGNAAR